MDSTERAAFRQASWVIGAVAAAFVVFFRLLVRLVYEVPLRLHADPIGTDALAAAGVVANVSEFLAYPILLLVAALLGFYLTAGRDLPPAPAIAGTFLGALVVPVGLVVYEVVDPSSEQPLIGPETVVQFATGTVGFVLPVVAAVAFGAVIDDLWERGAQFGTAGG